MNNISDPVIKSIYEKGQEFLNETSNETKTSEIELDTYVVDVKDLNDKLDVIEKEIKVMKEILIDLHNVIDKMIDKKDTNDNKVDKGNESELKELLNEIKSFADMLK